MIPTYNSSHYVCSLLESIQEAKSQFDNVEVLIVDDSIQEEATATRSLCERYGASFLSCKGNVSLKRNFGIQGASNEIIFFTDSDCILTPSTLLEHMKLAETDEKIGAMCGVVEFSGKENWLWPIIERTGLIGAYSLAKKVKFAPWSGAGNLSVKRHVLQLIGGFDQDFLRRPGGEDVDLGIRINKANYRILCNPNALVYHSRETWDSLRRMIPRAFGYGRPHYHLMRKHPDKVGAEYPRMVVVYFLILCLLLTKAVLFWQWRVLVAWPVFIFSTIIAQSIMILHSKNQSLRLIPIQAGALGLELTLEFGILYESLRHLDSRGIWARIIYSEDLLIHERRRKIIDVWSMFLGFLLVLLFF